MHSSLQMFHCYPDYFVRGIQSIQNADALQSTGSNLLQQLRLLLCRFPKQETTKHWRLRSLGHQERHIGLSAKYYPVLEVGQDRTTKKLLKTQKALRWKSKTFSALSREPETTSSCCCQGITENSQEDVTCVHSLASYLLLPGHKSAWKDAL